MSNSFIHIASQDLRLMFHRRNGLLYGIDKLRHRSALPHVRQRLEL